MPVPTSLPVTRARRSRYVVASIVLASLLFAVSPPSAAEDEVLSFPSPEDFVTQQYRDFLARDPDPGGLAYWASELRRGVNTGKLVEVMATSPEFANVVAPVVRLYEAHFRRPPDAAGLRFWADQFRAGMSLEQISQEFARSTEFVTTYGALDDTQFIDQVYVNVLGRPADAAGRTYWVATLQSGISRGAMVVQFSESPEFRAKTDGRVKAIMLYVGMLQRTPDPGGLDYWAGVLDNGAPYDAAIAGFLVSAEYSQRTRALFTEIHPLTGEATRAFERRPALVIKIDNHNRARPQVGINQADIVWEELVEGSITRFAAVFHEQAPAVIGPVRSARTGDIDLISQLNTPLFGASGANAGVLAAVADAPVVNVNALAAGSAYYRQSGRSAPHNLFARTRDLWAIGEARGGTPPQLLHYRRFDEAATGSPAAGVDIDFGNTSVNYRWNGAGWVRTQDGRTHVDGAGAAVAPPNVIVQITQYGVSAADAESPEAITIGSGTAFVYSAGTMTRATWSRTDARQPIVYRDLDGALIELTPGRTWIALAPPGTVTLR